MLCINSPSNDPYFNIATEEYFLKNFSQDIFIIYRNLPSVIVGKHQNALAEIDVNFARSEGVSIVRRMSGGGAVYHDLGNLNFSFIKNGCVGKLVDFKGFTTPVINALSKLGVIAKFEGHNSLTVNGRKISGNAEHVYKNRVLHHGTLLFKTNLNHLARILYVDREKFVDKAVRSKRAAVSNISEFLQNSLDIEEFSDFLYREIASITPKSVGYSLSNTDIERIQELANSKYRTWEWTFGYSPLFKVERAFETDHGAFNLIVEVDRGFIVNVSIANSSIRVESMEKISRALVGCQFDEQSMAHSLVAAGIEVSLVEAITKGVFV